MSLLVILIVLLVVSSAGGYWGQRNPAFGYYSWSPLAVLCVVVVVLWLTGTFETGRHIRLLR